MVSGAACCLPGKLQILEPDLVQPFFQAYYLLFLLYFKTGVINKMIPHPHPQDVHVLLPGICACYLIWQKGLCICNSIRIMKWGGDPGFFFFFGHVTWLVESQFPDQR